MTVPVVRNVRYRPAPILDTPTGLVGFVTCEIDNLLIDGIALRRSTGGRPILAYPTRRDREGVGHAIVLPADPEARAAIQGQVLEALVALGVRP